MTKRDVILVLEDSEEDRVTWLKKIVEPLGYWVEWHMSVDSFLAYTNVNPHQIALLVFDHDLGHVSSGMYASGSTLSYDRDGRCGLDAAREIGAHPVPALVWSWNTEGRKRIAYELSRSGKATKILSASFTASEDYAHQIKRLLG